MVVLARDMLHLDHHSFSHSTMSESPVFGVEEEEVPATEAEDDLPAADEPPADGSVRATAAKTKAKQKAKAKAKAAEQPANPPRSARMKRPASAAAAEQHANPPRRARMKRPASAAEQPALPADEPVEDVPEDPEDLPRKTLDHDSIPHTTHINISCLRNGKPLL